MAQKTIVYWRDIPAQVNGQSGRDRHQLLLSSKFQRAVDRAKRKAGIYTAEEDIAQWHRTSETCDDHVAARICAPQGRKSPYVVVRVPPRPVSSIFTI